jgi:hypothetical protein
VENGICVKAGTRGYIETKTMKNYRKYDRVQTSMTEKETIDLFCLCEILRFHKGSLVKRKIQEKYQYLLTDYYSFLLRNILQVRHDFIFLLDGWEKELTKLQAQQIKQLELF